MDKTYIISVTGKLASGVTRETAIAGFSQKFKLPPAKAEKFIDGNKKCLKKDADLKTAKQYKAVLDSLGIGCMVSATGNDVEQVKLKNTEKAKNPAPVPKKAAPESSSQKTPTKQVPEKAENDATLFQSDKNHPGLAFKIEGKPDYGFLTVNIPANETLKVEASAMATMDVNISMKTKMAGGLGRLLTGESMFINDFSADGGPGEIGIAPGPPGDLAHYYLDGEHSKKIGCSNV